MAIRKALLILCTVLTVMRDSAAGGVSEWRAWVAQQARACERWLSQAQEWHVRLSPGRRQLRGLRALRTLVELAPPRSPLHHEVKVSERRWPSLRAALASDPLWGQQGFRAGPWTPAELREFAGAWWTILSAIENGHDIATVGTARPRIEWPVRFSSAFRPPGRSEEAGFDLSLLAAPSAWMRRQARDLSAQIASDGLAFLARDPVTFVQLRLARSPSMGEGENGFDFRRGTLHPEREGLEFILTLARQALRQTRSQWNRPFLELQVTRLETIFDGTDASGVESSLLLALHEGREPGPLAPSLGFFFIFDGLLRARRPDLFRLPPPLFGYESRP